MNKDKRDIGKGLYQKYIVTRVDGRDGPGADHENCEYFVLDLCCDSLMVPALNAYAKAASEAGYQQLAYDLRMKVHEFKMKGIKWPGDEYDR